jgi:Protein of unknown function (DUF4232)
MIAAHHAAAPACHFSQLGVRLGQSSGAAGTLYVAIVFTNRGSASCSLRGYPGLSSVGGSDGHQIGAPATRQSAGRPITTVVLRPGGVASASYGQADALNFDKAVCHPVTALGLRVYPPNLTLARYLPMKHLACSSTKLPGNGSVISPVVRGPTGSLNG